MKNISIKLEHILNNKTSGSSELASLLNKYFILIRNNPDLINESIKIVKSKLGYFETVNSYLNKLKSILLKKDNNALNSFLKEYSGREDEKVEIIFNRIYPKLSRMQSIMTLSRSGTVLSVLKLWHQKNKNLKVVICESRPMFEGRASAMELIKNDIKVEIITDAMASLYVTKVDGAIIGSDLVLKNGNIVNKVGSKTLALLCREYKKPFYVVTTRSKLLKRNSFNVKKANTKEVWNKKAKNLKIDNIYFEVVEKKLITKIFTD